MIQTNIVLPDYLRFGSFDPAFYPLALANLRQLGDTQPGRFLQYLGHVVEGCFVGSAEQRNRTHSLVDAPGHWSGIWLPLACQLDPLTSARGTRLDLQITFENRFDYADARRELRGMRWPNGAPLYVDHVDGQNGHTLYIGERTSPVYWRFYQKETAAGLKLNRFEVELKQGRAEAAFRELVTGRATISDIFMRFVCDLPSCEVSRRLVTDVSWCVSNPVPVSLHVERTPDTEGWLTNVYMNALRRFLLAHPDSDLASLVTDLGFQMARTDSFDIDEIFEYTLLDGSQKSHG